MARLKAQMSDMAILTRGLERMLGSIFPYETAPVLAMWRPPTDVYETGDQVVIKVEIAGVNPDEIRISFANRILQISGKRPDNQFKRSCHRLEIPYGEFLSQVYLPGNYDQDRIEANYKDGFLTIALPKVRPESRNIAIQTTERE